MNLNWPPTNFPQSKVEESTLEIIKSPRNTKLLNAHTCLFSAENIHQFVQKLTRKSRRAATVFEIIKTHRQRSHLESLQRLKGILIRNIKA